MATPRPDSDAFFLPNFCDVGMVFAVVVIGELLAFLLALAPFTGGDHWGQLGLISLFVQWVGLSSAAALCAARPFLGRMRENAAASTSYILLLLITLALSEAAYRIASITGFGWDMSPSWHVELLLRNLAVSAIVCAMVLRYFYVTHQWKMQTKAEAQARVQALQARIRPHFLFNSMNTIASLTRSDPVLAEEAVEDLADVFRQSLADPRQQVTFAEELELTRRYVRIEQLRLGERLQVRWNVESVPHDALLPPLCLQPLLENAIYHGIEPRTQGGVIEVNARVEPQRITITIDNPLPDSNTPAHEGNRMAMENIRLRFEALYGTGSHVKTQQDAQRFHVELSFPYQKSSA